VTLAIVAVNLPIGHRLCLTLSWLGKENWVIFFSAETKELRSYFSLDLEDQVSLNGENITTGRAKA